MKKEIEEVLNKLCDHTALVVTDKKMGPVNISEYVGEIMFIAGCQYLEDKVSYLSRILEAIKNVK